ncbi:hypothetical protein LR48_Vigan07g045500 [Vigna angularis]|uniref:Uncharacterized protein n=1 Tax=Phaseolus angularis TaxID=3914 RepID=A0A0L9UVJ3_PHAAN|nr:hypothetical protein LR48_Vigan07g045500 [Vigna angularis]
MSFLAGRLAGKEAAYFFQESKQAVGKLAQKNPIPKSNSNNNNNLNFHEEHDHSDVLPEVLRHHLPSRVFRNDEVTTSSFSASKWVLPSDPKIHSSVSPDALNPLLGKAFAVATAFVFGGAALVFGTVASKLELHNISDIKTKGKEYVEPQLESIKEQFAPFKIWASLKLYFFSLLRTFQFTSLTQNLDLQAENVSKKWHKEEEDVKQKTIVKELSKIWGRKTSD